MYGFTGDVLRVDLTEGKTEVNTLEEDFYKKFLGGVGIGAKAIFDEVPPEVDALDPENRLIFAGGPFQNTGILGTGRWSVSSKSPLTGIWGESNAGGALSIKLRSAGFDAIIIQGKAEKPVYLWIHDDEREIKDASKLWGLDSYQTYDKIMEELGESKADIVTIGQAGENLVRMANIVDDKKGFAGRTGMGAVMGSKNLKAIAVFGTSDNIEVANPEKLKELNTDLIREQAKKAGGLREHGMSYFLPTSYDYRNAPIKNWSQGDWTRGVVTLSPPRYTEILKAKGGSCPGVCPIACRREVTVDEPEKYAFKGAGPEYEALGLLGTNLLIGDIKALAKLNDLCNRYGIDVVSTGSAIGVIMECYEKGILTKEDINGLELNWGDADVAIKLLEKIVNREGIGDKLANGTLSAAKEMGEEVVKIVQHVKGLDFPAHDPRACNYMGLNYATSNRGACHVRGISILDWYQVHMHPQAEIIAPITIPELGFGVPPKSGWRGQSKYVILSQNWGCLWDSLVQCKVMEMWGKDEWGIGFGNQLKLLNYVTGWNLSPEEFIKIGERIFNLQRAFNVREGISRKDDQLPSRAFEKAHPSHSITPLSPLLDEYYKNRGWTSDGKPTKDKLLELDLNEVANALWVN